MKKAYKADEMEMSINLRALRFAWAYSSVFLFIWISYDWISNSEFNSFAFILLVSQLVVFWSVLIFLKWKLGKDEE